MTARLRESSGESFFSFTVGRYSSGGTAVGDIIKRVTQGAHQNSSFSPQPRGRCLSDPPAAPHLRLGTGPAEGRMRPRSLFQHHIVVPGRPLRQIEILREKVSFP